MRLTVELQWADIGRAPSLIIGSFRTTMRMLGWEKRMPRVTSLPSPAFVRPRPQPTLHRPPPAPFSFHQAQLPYQVPAWLLGTPCIVAHPCTTCQVSLLIIWYRDTCQAVYNSELSCKCIRQPLQHRFGPYVSPIYLNWIRMHRPGFSYQIQLVRTGIG
jgi:hypothetical protein